MKKILILLLTLAMSFSAYVSAPAAEGGVSVYLDGSLVSYSQSDGQPQIINGRAYVPLRRTCDALGIDIDFNANTKVLKMTKDGDTVTHTIGTKILKINSGNYIYGSEDDLSLVSVVIDGRVLMPIRLLADSIGCYAYWDSDAKSVIIKTEADSSDGEYAGKWYYNSTWIADGWGGIAMPLNMTVSYCDSQTIQGEWSAEIYINEGKKQVPYEVVVPFSSELYTDSNGVRCFDTTVVGYDYYWESDGPRTFQLKYKDGEPIIQFREIFYLIKK